MVRAFTGGSHLLFLGSRTADAILLHAVNRVAMLNQHSLTVGSNPSSPLQDIILNLAGSSELAAGPTTQSGRNRLVVGLHLPTRLTDV